MPDAKEPWYVYGNWKLHGSALEAQQYFSQWPSGKPPSELRVGIAVPAPLIAIAVEKAEGLGVAVGAQDCSARWAGSFTGEISAVMERDVGASFVILGHYERRHYFNENPLLIREKVLRAVDAGLQVVLCCGETLEERQSGHAQEVIRWQLKESLKEIIIPELLIAYEPGWAIGTGEPARPEDVTDIMTFIQQQVDELQPQCRTPLLYGGSVTAENVLDYRTMDVCSGVLIGTASLNPHNFLQILQRVR